MNRPRFSRYCPAALLACAFFVAATIANAAVITDNPFMPTSDPQLIYAGQFHSYPGANLDGPRHYDFNNISRNSVGDDEEEEFDSSFSAKFMGNDVILTGPVKTVMRDRAIQSTGLFQTEILSMDLSGTLPGVGPVLIRQSTLTPSLGETTITDLLNGTWEIESYFDIVTELSLDGGNNWVESIGVTRMLLQVPEPSTLFLLALGLAGFAYQRRRHAAS